MEHMERQYTILYVEDDPEDQFLVKAAVRRTGRSITLHFAENGKDLLRYLLSVKDEAGRPDLILMDLNMPEMDGFETLKYIKRNETCRRVPTIVFTTALAPDQVHKCYDLGANAIMMKPQTFSEFEQVIGEMLSYWLDRVRLS